AVNWSAAMLGLASRSLSASHGCSSVSAIGAEPAITYTATSRSFTVLSAVPLATLPACSILMRPNDGSSAIFLSSRSRRRRTAATTAMPGRRSTFVAASRRQPRRSEPVGEGGRPPLQVARCVQVDGVEEVLRQFVLEEQQVADAARRQLVQLQGHGAESRVD